MFTLPDGRLMPVGQGPYYWRCGNERSYTEADAFGLVAGWHERHIYLQARHCDACGHFHIDNPFGVKLPLLIVAGLTQSA